LLLRAKQWPNRSFFDRIAQVEKNQWISRDQLQELAWQKQKALVKHAYEKTPFYKEKYSQAGFEPGDLRRREDFERLPVLTKGEVRQNLERMRMQNLPEDRVRTMFTGGSTGVPLKVYQDRQGALWNDPMRFRTHGAWGLKMGVRIAHIWGLNPLNEQYEQNQQSSWHRYLHNFVLLSAFDMTEEKMVKFAGILARYKPHLIISYTSAMYTFANFLLENGGPKWKTKAVWLTSEPIHDFQKQCIEQALSAPVYNQYGSVEVFYYAAQCRQRDGLHINSDFRTLEVVDEQGRGVGPGELGQVVVTDLVNYACPLIRYRNEDMASLVANSCPCGSSLPLMSEVTGRVYDMFGLKDGTQVYGHRFTTFFYSHIDKVKTFQVHQISLDRALVKIVPVRDCPRQELKEALLTAFREYTKGQMDFEVSFVEEIARESSGKYRFVKSELVAQR
ncbi:MAG: hypothetical protein KKC78_08550, partial [Proteobacteria bacterium]|nr:hypothetical protein [Pseudomonadota bacterium]